MKLKSLILSVGLVTCNPAYAQSTYAYDEGSVSVLVHNRGDTPSDRTLPSEDLRHEVETPYGVAVVLHTSTRNSDCIPACPDYVEVVAPEGYVAVPYLLTIEEGGYGVFYLLPFVGS